MFTLTNRQANGIALVVLFTVVFIVAEIYFRSHGWEGYFFK